MAEYLYLIDNTYSNTSNRNTARDAIQAVLDANPSIIAEATSLPAGLNTTANTGLTLSVRLPEGFDVEAFRDSMRPAWTSGIRSSTYVSTVKAT